ncbi:MAG: hypothetical protein IJ227_00720 [Mogibacterium sp.]|nr:hypothetical protein [Mogibacterium sp.]
MSTRYGNCRFWKHQFCGQIQIIVSLRRKKCKKTCFFFRTRYCDQ